MIHESLRWKIGFGVLLSFLLLCCTKSDDTTATATNAQGTFTSPSVNINLADIQREGCLDLQKYFQHISSLSPQTPVFEVSTNLNFSSKDSIRENFKKIMAYGNLLFSTKPLAQFYDFQQVDQNACESLTFKNDDGSESVFKIEPTSAAEKLVATNETGEKVEYTWLSPMSIRITTKTVAYDMPCSGPTEIFVEQTRVLDWSQAPLSTIDPLTSPMAIDPDLLTLFAKAVGYNESGLYQVIPADAMGPERRLILPAKVQEMMSLPPNPALLTCSSSSAPPPVVTPDPTPTPDPDIQPTPTPDPTTPDPTPTPDPGSNDDSNAGDEP